MPVIGLSLALLPVLAVLALRGLAKLIMLPFQALRLVSRGRSPLGIGLAIGLVVAGGVAWMEPGRTPARLIAMAVR
ncbi:hypothetical protein [Methylobacterium nigriterrae]|uniref:hypothetical protein n=1 Tax=Methylobacterium nigriterrae TaxID=3127512 RepID=UPI0030136233